MSAPKQEPSPQKKDSQATSPRQGRKEPVERDIIPVWLIVSIFAVVLAVTAWLLHDNWTVDMARYRSIRAQQTGDFKGAIKHLNKLIDIAKEAEDERRVNNPTFLSELGYSYSRLEDYENALKYYLLAQQHRANMGNDEQGNPRPPADFSNRLGHVYFKLGNLEAAEEALNTAIERDKLDPLANFTLGELAMQRGQYMEAADHFKVVVSNPNYAEQVSAYYDEIEEKLFAGI